jgi:hypothetical protein
MSTIVDSSSMSPIGDSPPVLMRTGTGPAVWPNVQRFLYLTRIPTNAYKTLQDFSAISDSYVKMTIGVNTDYGRKEGLTVNMAVGTFLSFVW